MKIAFFEMEKWENKYVKDKLKRHKLSFFDEPLELENVRKAKDCEGICVFVNSKINETILDNLPKVKFICAMSTGFDHIDLDECKSRGIKVYNVPDYAEHTVAEHTFALILSLSRRICESWNAFKRGDFDLDELKGFDLDGKTLGIVGVGSIGEHVIKMAKSFEMNVIAYDIFKNNKLAKKLKFKYVNFDSLLKNSDIVSLHCPLTDDNEYMINSKAINKMKKGAILINTARGKLVNTVDMVKAVKDGKLAGVGLDVLENEEEIKEDPEVLFKKSMKKSKVAQLESSLLKLDNVILTPHNAFNSQESLYRLLDTTVENVNSFLKKRNKNNVRLN